MLNVPQWISLFHLLREQKRLRVPVYQRRYRLAVEAWQDADGGQGKRVSKDDVCLAAEAGMWSQSQTDIGDGPNACGPVGNAHTVVRALDSMSQIFGVEHA